MIIFKGANAINDIRKIFNGGNAGINNNALNTDNMIIPKVCESFLVTYKFPIFLILFIFIINFIFIFYNRL